jgi:Fic family protein
MVNGLIKDLLSYLKTDNDIALIKSCIFHYEFEFILPFIDGNGRMGRLWQTLILKGYSPIFEFLPIESIIKERQIEYYCALAKVDKMGNSTCFIQFMLEVILLALEQTLASQNINLTPAYRI